VIVEALVGVPGVRGASAEECFAGFRPHVSGPGGLEGHIVVVPWRRRCQVRAGSARIACNTVRKSVFHGQRAGSRSVHCRLLRVSRPGI
jgi:hypothetical protein